jgi:hypothetical protein
LARPVKHDGGLYKRDESKVWWMRYRDKDGIRRRESTLTEDWDEAQMRLRERLQARDNNTLSALRRGQDIAFGEWADFYLENFSKPPFRAPKTHGVNQRPFEASENHVRERQTRRIDRRRYRDVPSWTAQAASGHQDEEWIRGEKVC